MRTAARSAFSGMLGSTLTAIAWSAPKRRLQARGIVDMGYGRHFRAHRAQRVEALERPLALGQREPPPLSYAGHQQHVGAVALELEPVAHILAQHGRSKRAKRFPEFDLQVELRLHGRLARVGQNGTVAQRTRTELHAALKPSQHLLP